MLVGGVDIVKEIIESKHRIIVLEKLLEKALNGQKVDQATHNQAVADATAELKKQFPNHVK